MAIILLIPLVVITLAATMNLLAALSIGGLLVILAIVGLLVWMKKRVNA